MSTYDNLKRALGDAMKARDELRMRVLRSVIAACTNELVAQKRKPSETLDDASVIAVLKRECKKRTEAMEQFTIGKRPELALREAEELEVLKTWLPETMSDDDISRIAEAAREKLGLTSPADKGKLIGAVMRETGGAADGADVKRVVDSLF